MGKTTGYKLQWKSGDQDFSSARQASVTGILTVNYIIPDLDYTTEYMVRVIAFNSHGDGPASDSGTGTPKQGKPKTGIAGMLRGDVREGNAQQPRGSQSQVATLGLDPAAHLDAGQEVTLTLTVAEPVSYLLEVTGGRGVTLSGQGVLDQGGGMAQLDANSWSEGQRTVVLKDTAGTDTLSVELLDTAGDLVAALEPRIVYNPEVRHGLRVTGLPDTLAVSRPYPGEVSVRDRYGNLRLGDDREVVISADQTGVSSSSPVSLEAGTGGFWVRSDSLRESLVLTFSDADESTLSQSESVAVRPLDAPDELVVTDRPGDEGGFLELRWDLSVDHSILNGYRIFREQADESPGTEWAWVAADPDAAEGRAVVATLDTISTGWGIAAQRGGPQATGCAEIAVLGEEVDGLSVEVLRGSGLGRVSSSAPILWKGATDATGRVTLAVSNRLRTGKYRAIARDADGQVVGYWTNISLTFGQCILLELPLGGTARVDTESSGPTTVLRSSVTRSGPVRAVDNIAPAAVPSLRAVDAPDDDGGRILLTWGESPSDQSVRRSVEGALGPVVSDMSRGVAGYRIYRKPAEGAFALIGTVGPGIIGFVDSTAANGERFTYTVAAFDEDNETGSEEQSAMAIRNREVAVNGQAIQGLFGADRSVGFDDYFHFADHYGSTAADAQWEPAFDLAAKQAVDVAGFNVFAENFGRQTASAAKVIPLRPGQNEQTRLDFYGDVPLPRVGEEFVLTVHVSDFGLLKGYGFQLEFDAEELEVVRAVAADNGLGEGTLAAPQVLAVEDGKRAIVAYGNAVSEGTVAVDIVFRALREFETGFIKVSEGQVRDGAFAVNPLALPAPVQMETLPEVYALGFNYPNPFNPETTIKYALPQTSDVKLVIYNSIGQVVRTLVAERQSIGRYAFTWDATNDRGQAVSSGIYLYRLQAGEFAKVRKMLLLK